MSRDSEDLDAAMVEAVELCQELTSFDLSERKAGRITLAYARFDAAITYVKVILGFDTDELKDEDE